MKYIYRVRFIGMGKNSIGHTSELQKTLVFETPQTYESIRLRLYDTHQHIKVLKILDLSKAGMFREVE